MHTFSHKCEVVGNPYLSIAFKTKARGDCPFKKWAIFFLAYLK